MRISDWSSDVCSSDLGARCRTHDRTQLFGRRWGRPATGSAQGWSMRGGRRMGAAMVALVIAILPGAFRLLPTSHRVERADRKSVVEGKSGSVSVDRGGRRNLKKTKKRQSNHET